MTDNFEKKVAVDGPVVNAGELGSSTFSPGQALPAGPLGLGQRWTVARKREVVLRLLRDEPVQLLSRQLGVEIFRLEQWREKAIGPDGLLDRKAAGPPHKLSAEQRAALAGIVETGPDPAIHDVVRWRRCDLARWPREQFGVSVSEVTVGRELRRMGYAKLSARPRHYAQDDDAVAAFKKTTLSA